MPIGDSMSQPIPAVGTPGTSYAAQLVAFLTEVKARLTAKVPVTSIVAALFDMANNALANVAYVGLYERTSAPAAPIGSLQRYQNDLWYVSASGAFKVTNGAALNASSIAGITGDYGGANPAQFRFIDADQTYYAYDDLAGAAWARVWARSFDIAQGATGSQRVRLQWAGSTSYTITLPSAAPGSTSLMQMDSSGNITASNNPPNLGATTFTGAITEQAAPKHTYTRTRVFNPATFQSLGPTFTATPGPSWTVGVSTAAIICPIDVDDGDQIIAWRLRVRNFSASGTITAGLYKFNSSTNTETLIGTTSTASATSSELALAKSGLTETVGGGNLNSYYVKFTGGGSTGDVVCHLYVDTTRP